MTPTEQRLESVLRSWQGTPWSKGQCCKGRAVDCYFFVCGVFDELYQVTDPLPPRLPFDTGVNNRPESQVALRRLMSRYLTAPLEVGPYVAGDVLIVRPTSAHESTLQHAVIVGPGGRTWHAGKGGVGYLTIEGWPVTHAFRMLDQNRWLQPAA